jgi:hypothetical protein
MHAKIFWCIFLAEFCPWQDTVWIVLVRASAGNDQTAILMPYIYVYADAVHHNGRSDASDS